jgi:RNA polymerase sigma-70 factor (ECF subfamily)
MTAPCSFLGQQRFSRLHSRLFPKLIGFLSHQIPRQEAEEIAQEALLKVYQRLQTALGNNESWSDEHLTALTYAIAKNLLVSRARHLKVRWQYHEQQRTQLSAEQPCNAEQAIINDDMHRHLLAAINRLPAICRNVFILRQIHNKRYQDIAAELNISIKTVENHLAKGMKLCRQYMIESVNEESVNQAMDSTVCK